MERYIRWFARLHLYYQILFAGAFVFGLAALLSGLATRNPVFILLAAFWLLAAPAAIWLSERNESGAD